MSQYQQNVLLWCYDRWSELLTTRNSNKMFWKMMKNLKIRIYHKWMDWHWKLGTYHISWWNNVFGKLFWKIVMSRSEHIANCHGKDILLYFDLLTRPKNAIPRWCTGRMWHILMAVMRGNCVGGNWLMKWDEVKKFPWYTHRLMHRKRVTCELHDSYFRLMTIKHAISKIE